MPVIPAGSGDNTGFNVPNVYVQIQNPSVTVIEGVPTNILAVVGTSNWGPVNAPGIVGSLSELTRTFGTMQAQKHDLPTAINVGFLQNAQNFVGVRVTDGTDTAATGDIDDTAAATGVTITAKYTGTRGNSLTASISEGAGSTPAAKKYKVTITMLGMAPEVFDGIGGTGAALWANIATAINSGIGITPPSTMVVATVPGAPSVLAPALASYPLAGGTNGDTTITGATLVGVDTGNRTGMYALRSTGASMLNMADLDDTTQWSTVEAFARNEGMYAVVSGSSAESISTAVTNKQAGGFDSPYLKIMLGDWCLFNDTLNGVLRYVAPASYNCGVLASFGPQESSLNKELFGIVGTQKSESKQKYSNADLEQLAINGIDVIANPVPGGSYFGSAIGHNTSSNPLLRGDNYTRLTNFLAYSIADSMGAFIGELQSPAVRKQAKDALQSFMARLQSTGVIGSADGSQAYFVQLNDANNPPTSVALGIMNATVLVKYLSVIEEFVIDLNGSQATVIPQSVTAQ